MSFHWTVRSHEKRPDPDTSNVAEGLVVQNPSLPPDSKSDEFMIHTPPVANRVIYPSVPPRILDVCILPLPQ